MNLDKKIAGVKVKYMMIAAPIVIIGALYLRSRSSSSSASSQTTGTADTGGDTSAGLTDPTTGATVAGSSDGSSSGTPSTPTTDPSSSSIADPYQQEVGDLMTVFAGLQASAQTPNGALEAQAVSPADQVPAAQLAPQTGRITIPPALVKTPNVSRMGAQAKTLQQLARPNAGAAIHHAAPSHPDQHKTAAAPNHAKPPTLGARLGLGGTVAKRATPATHPVAAHQAPKPAAPAQKKAPVKVTPAPKPPAKKAPPAPARRR